MGAEKEIIHIINEDISEMDILKQITNSRLQQNPFYVFNINNIIKKYIYWNEILPRVKPYYAVKCNNHPAVLKILSTLGTAFACASRSEIDQVISIGVEPNRIIFSNTTKLPQHLSHAAATNVNLLTFDNELELFKIHNLHPTARVLIRIKCEATKESYSQLGVKFGCDSRTEAFPLLQTAQKLGINVVGVSFHIGPCCKDATAFYGAIEVARHVFDLALELNFNFDLLNIGGGYPKDISEEMFQFSEIINLSLKKFFPDDSVKVIAEPGTYFVGSAFTLNCCIHSMRTIEDEESAKKKYMYFLNDGVFGSFACVLLYNKTETPITLKEFKEDKTYPSILWGPTCDSADQINGDVLLPKMELGDWLTFKNMGAYTMTVSTCFNSFESTVVYNFISFNNRLLLQNKSFVHTEEVIHENGRLDLKKIIINRELII